MLSSASTFAANEVLNDKELRKKQGVEKFDPSGYELSQLKVAILDNGFSGYQQGKGMLPDSAELIAGPKNPEASTSHGLGMAQIVWAMTGKRAEGPKFYLVNTNGFTNFKAAIDFVINNKVDIVVYSQVWEFGSNFDGRGFINAQVNRATERGVIWVNAAGNFSKMIFNTLIDDKIQRDKTLMLRKKAQKDYIRFENKYDQNNVSVILSWSDFKDDENYNAVKDLDLFVYDEKGKLVGASELIQRGEKPPEDDASSKLSSYAREIVTLNNLDRGTYQIKVVAKSDNFFPKDELRILLKTETANSLIFTDRTAGYEIMPPADNASVFTVGEDTMFSSEGPTADKRVKPNVIVEDAKVSFSNGKSTSGSSNATAIVAGGITLMKAMCKGLDFDALENYATKLKTKVKMDEDLSEVELSDISKEIREMIPTGGKIMESSYGQLVILTPVDPLTLPMFTNLKKKAERKATTDIITVSKKKIDGSRKWYIYPVENFELIGDDKVEFRRLRSEIGVWKLPKPSNSCLK